MSYPLIILSIILSIIPLPADNGTKLLAEIPVSSQKIVTDELGNIYMTDRSELTKFDPKGNITAIYSDKNYGEITSVDVSDPLKILLFYKDFTTIVFLDNTLSPVSGKLNLADAGIMNPHLAARSHDNALWIFTTSENSLLKISMQGEILSRTADLNNLFGVSERSVMMLERNNELFIVQPDAGIFVFDVFGNYKNTLPFKGLEQIQVRGKKLIYNEGKRLRKFDLETSDTSSVPYPDTSAIRGIAEKERLFLVKKNSLLIYSVND